MKFIGIAIIIVALTCFSCKHKIETVTVKINISKPDTCIELSTNDSALFRRDIEILENTLSDTIGLGFAVVYPGETGRQEYLRDGKELFYVIDSSQVKDLPPIHTVCFDAYLKRPVHGTITLRFKRHY